MVDFPKAPPTSELATFPSRVLRSGRSIFRLHHRELGPFWFNSTELADTGGNRFDLPSPDGASYWALQPVVALLETLVRRPVQTIPADLLDRFSLTEATLPHDLERVANIPVKAARRFGLTAEIHTTDDRQLTRGWAVALAHAGYQAVVALPRHDVTGRHRTLTLWGPKGEHSPYGWEWDPTTGTLGSVVHDLEQWGIRVLPVPFEVPIVKFDPGH